MIQKYVKFLSIALLITLLTGCNAAKPVNNEQSGGTLIDPPKAITTDKPFTSQFDKPLYLSDFRGRVALIFFGYTSCPDVCPITMSDFTRIRTILGGAAADVSFIFISVDPKRDTPDVLRTYLAAFDPSFVGLRTDEATLQALAKDFYTTFGAEDDKGLVEHGSRSYLIDTKGLWRVSYPLGTPVQAVADDIQGWLAKK